MPLVPALFSLTLKKIFNLIYHAPRILNLLYHNPGCLGPIWVLYIIMWPPGFNRLGSHIRPCPGKMRHVPVPANCIDIVTMFIYTFNCHWCTSSVRWMAVLYIIVYNSPERCFSKNCAASTSWSYLGVTTTGQKRVSARGTRPFPSLSWLYNMFACFIHLYCLGLYTHIT